VAEGITVGNTTTGVEVGVDVHAANNKMPRNIIIK
jgi:hypothetical protein